MQFFKKINATFLILIIYLSCVALVRTECSKNIEPSSRSGNRESKGSLMIPGETTTKDSTISELKNLPMKLTTSFINSTYARWEFEPDFSKVNKSNFTQWENKSDGKLCGSFPGMYQHDQAYEMVNVNQAHDYLEDSWSAGGAHYPGADVSVAIVDTGTINHSALYPRVYDVHYIDVNWYRWNFWIWPRYVYVAQLYHIDSTSDWEYCEDWNPEHDYLDEDSILYQKKGIYDGYQTPGWDYGHGTGVTGALLRMAPFLGTWQGGQLILVDIIDCPYLDELADLWPRKEAWELGLYALNYWFDPNVVSISYGDPSSSFLVDEIDDLQSDGRTVVVAAAGNDDKEDVVYPAALENVVAVGAVYARSPQPPEVPIAWVDEDDYGVRVTEGAGVEWGSNYGPEIEVMGPGRFVWTFGGTPYTNWVKMEGTSVATPIVAGVFALVFQAYYYEHGQFPLSDVARELVEFHCDPGGQDTDNFDTDDTSTRQNNYYGYGIVDAWEALNAVGPTC